MCKDSTTEMCGRVADRVVQIFGGQGYLKEGGIERFHRDVGPPQASARRRSYRPEAAACRTRSALGGRSSRPRV